MNEKGYLKITGNLAAMNKNIFLHLRFENLGDESLVSMAIQFDKNILGLKPENKKISFDPPVASGNKKDLNILLVRDGELIKDNEKLDVALKNKVNKKISYFSLQLDKSVLFQKYLSDIRDFISKWKEIMIEKSFNYSGTVDLKTVEKKIFLKPWSNVMKKNKNVTLSYYSIKTYSDEILLVEVKFESSLENEFTVTMKCKDEQMIDYLIKFLEKKFNKL